MTSFERQATDGTDGAVDRLATMRRRMVTGQIRARGVRHPDVLAAMRTVPRHRFVPDHITAGEAYSDRALSLGPRQTISQPYVIARMTELVVEDGGPRDRALEIGTGSGYQAAVLAELFGRVVTVERDTTLATRARERLEEMHYRNVDVRAGDGRLGAPDAGPFDAILITAGLSEVPKELLDQLTPGTGRMVAPVGPDQDHLQLRVFRASADGSAPETEDVLPVRFVPLV